MSNEEKILEKLERMSFDIDILKARVAQLEHGGKIPVEAPSVEKQIRAIDGLSHLLDDDEKKRFGAFMDAEKSRKEAIYD